MRLQGIGKSDVGMRREGNEDAFLINESLGVYIVCDGMGGHAAGEVASATTTRVIGDYLLEHQDIIKSFEDTPQKRKQVIELLKSAVLLACKTVFDMAQEDTGKKGMGTTVTMLLFLGNKAALAHVGDSRLYLCRAGKIYMLSSDHTLVAELLARGALTPEAAEESPLSNVLTRSIGRQPSVQVDTLMFDLLTDDTFLLCSDGLTGSVNNPDELSRLLSQPNLEDLPGQLIEMANERDGSDNITAVLVRTKTDEDPQADEAWSDEVRLRLEALRNVYLFKHLNLKELVQVMNIVHVRNCNEGDLLIKEGDKSDGLFIILEGTLSVSRGGQEITVLSQGNHVGEMALLNREPRSATVRVVEDARVLVIEREAFYRILRTDPKIGVKLLWSVSQELSLRLSETDRRFFGPHQSGDAAADLLYPFLS